MTLKEFFEQNGKCAMGYSGGVDSAYLLYKAVEFGVDIKPFFVRSQFTTDKECSEAVAFAKSLGCAVEIIDIDLLDFPSIRRNDQNRCYYCKKTIFSAICKSAYDAGFDIILEGTNSSDDIADRPGFKAITELGIISPLKLCGLTKDYIRSELKKADICIWDKPASACLATRIQCGTEISYDNLYKVQKSEEVLSNMGFCDFRVRYFCGSAKIQVKAEQFNDVVKLRNEICNGLEPYFHEVFLDLKER